MHISYMDKVLHLREGGGGGGGGRESTKLKFTKFPFYMVMADGKSQGDPQQYSL